MEERNVAQPPPAVDGVAQAPPPVIDQSQPPSDGPGMNVDLIPPEPPAPTAPQKHVCPECGKQYTTKQALGTHRAKTHGVAGKSKAAAARSRSKLGVKPRKPRARKAGPGPESVLAVFQRLATAIESRAELDQEIVRGMGLIVKAVKSLRKVTLKTRKELLDLRRQMAGADFAGE